MWCMNSAQNVVDVQQHNARALFSVPLNGDSTWRTMALEVFPVTPCFRSRFLMTILACLAHCLTSCLTVQMASSVSSKFSLHAVVHISISGASPSSESLDESVLESDMLSLSLVTCKTRGPSAANTPHRTQSHHILRSRRLCNAWNRQFGSLTPAFVACSDFVEVAAFQPVATTRAKIKGRLRTPEVTHTYPLVRCNRVSAYGARAVARTQLF